MASRFSKKYIMAKLWGTYLKIATNPPSEYFSLPGYLHPLEGRFLYWLASHVPQDGLALEVGSFKGKSSNFLAAGLSGRASLVCVDTWKNDAMPYDAKQDVYDEFLQNTFNYKNCITPIRGHSSEIASSWKQPLDLLFIDGDHSYNGCKSDLLAWLRFVKPGGWVAFHDSGEEGVTRAIAEEFPIDQRGLQLQAWSILAIKKS